MTPYDKLATFEEQPEGGGYRISIPIPPPDHFDDFTPFARQDVLIYYQRRHGDGYRDGDMLALCLVSHELNAYLAPFLYAHVTIRRPSTLYLFARSILNNPGLRTHVQSLWVGDKTPHPSPLWPLTPDGWHAESNGLRASVDVNMPAGVPPGQPWLLTSKYGSIWVNKEQTILAKGTRRMHKIIRHFCDSVFQSNKILCLQQGKEGCAKYFDDEVTPLYHPIFMSEHAFTEQLEEEGETIKLSKALWTIKLYQVQAYLDSYMEVIHKWERENGRGVDRGGRDTWYSVDLAQQAAFIRECADNIKPPRDRFDDPVLYARAGAYPYCCGDPATDDAEQEVDELYQGDRPDDHEDFDFLRNFEREYDAYWAWISGEPNINGVITALHMVIKRLPNVDDLQLEGALHRAVKGEFIKPGRLPKSALPLRAQLPAYARPGPFA